MVLSLLTTTSVIAGLAYAANMSARVELPAGMLRVQQLGDMSWLTQIGSPSWTPFLLGGLLVQLIVWASISNSLVYDLYNRDLRYGPGSVVVLLVLPILNVVHTLAVFQEIWRGSDPDTILTDETAWMNSQPSRLITLWWLSLFGGVLLWLVSGIPMVRYWVPSLSDSGFSLLRQQLLVLPQAAASLLMCLSVVRTHLRLRERYQALLRSKNQSHVFDGQVVSMADYQMLRQHRQRSTVRALMVVCAVLLCAGLAVGLRGVDFGSLLASGLEQGKNLAVKSAAVRSARSAAVSQATGNKATTVPVEKPNATMEPEGTKSLLILSLPNPDLGFSFAAYVTPEGYLGIKGRVLAPAPNAAVMAWTKQKPSVNVTVPVGPEGKFELTMPIPGPSMHTIYIGTNTGNGPYTSRGSITVQQSKSRRATYDTKSSAADGVQILEAGYSAGLQVSLRLDENGYTIVEGTAPPNLGLVSALVWDEAKSFNQVPAPVQDGRFSARLRLLGGESYELLIGGSTSSRGDQKTSYAEFSRVSVQIPVGINPHLASAGGLVAEEVILSEGGIELTPVITADGQLRLNLVIDPSVGYSDFLFYTPDDAQHPFRINSLAEAGRSSVTFPLPGPATHTIRVGRKVSNGYYSQIGMLIVKQTSKEERTPARVFSGRVQLASTISGGGDYSGTVPIIGRIVGPIEHDSLVVATISKETSTGALEAKQTIPVIDGQFSGRAWLRFGPGRYSIKLGIPSGNNQWSTAVEISANNISDQDVRYLAPSMGVESDDIRIRQLAESLTASIPTANRKVIAIHDWVARNISYDVAKLRSNTFRLSDGAVRTLESRKGVCGDYSKLTVALLRAAGVEARMARGKAQGYGGWGLHAWVEAYVEGKWITMDPTWNSGFLQADKFVPSFSHRYFDPAPDIFAETHSRSGHEF